MADKKQPESKLVYSTAAGDMRKAPEKKPAQLAPVPAREVRVALDTKGRRGKTMTSISGIDRHPQGYEDLAKMLKNLCGTGGTVEQRVILLQGEHRQKVASKLKEMGFKVRVL